jgi:hypothetical protein
LLVFAPVRFIQPVNMFDPDELEKLQHAHSTKNAALAPPTSLFAVADAIAQAAVQRKVVPQAVALGAAKRPRDSNDPFDQQQKVQRLNEKRVAGAAAVLPDVLDDTLAEIAGGIGDEYGMVPKTLRNRIDRYGEACDAAEEPAWPLTRRSGLIFLAFLIKGNYATGDDYYRHVRSWAEACGERRYALCEADCKFHDRVLAKYARSGLFVHKQHDPVHLDQILDAKPTKDAGRNLLFRAAASFAFVFGLRPGEFAMLCPKFRNPSELITFRPETRLWRLDLSGFKCKSNHTRIVFLRCVCATVAAAACPCRTLKVLKIPTGGLLDEYEVCFERAFPDKHKHGIRVGLLQLLISSGAETGATRRFLRWWGPNMVDYYDRGNEFRASPYSDVQFLPTTARHLPQEPDFFDEERWVCD